MRKTKSKYVFYDLQLKLLVLLTKLQLYKIHPHIINQIFSQIAYFINTVCMNEILVRKDLVNWSKGLSIKYNISQLEHFYREIGQEGMYVCIYVYMYVCVYVCV